MVGFNKNSISADILEQAKRSKRIVFVSGNFNVIHPGHLRLLNFASSCGDFLVVGVTRDGADGVLIREDLRLEGVRAISAVNFAFLLEDSVEKFLTELKPHIVVKGKEYETQYNHELSVIEEYGGKLLFSSGDTLFSSMDLLQQEIYESNFIGIQKPRDFPIRHGFNVYDLIDKVRKFDSLKVIVLGDLIVDEYVTCDPLGMSQEDPTIVVTPIKHDLFIGGAGIVASHAQSLGAHVKYFGVSGKDQTAKFAASELRKQSVDLFLIEDESRPTTLKQRYRAHGKTLLRVSHLRQHSIGRDLIAQIIEELDNILGGVDLLVFSDFNYGALPQLLIEEVMVACKRHGVRMVADSQSSSQVGDISRFQEMMLITPTEHEARLAIREAGIGLAFLAESLQKKTKAANVFISLGSEGLLVHAPDNATDRFIVDQLAAFNKAPKDVSGAGDSLLICASLALAVGASIWESAYLGSIAAACQVSRVGNTPLSADELIRELMR
jgi:rfaE bifunctional protein kinase chain/domain